MTEHEEGLPPSRATKNYFTLLAGANTLAYQTLFTFLEEMSPSTGVIERTRGSFRFLRPDLFTPAVKDTADRIRTAESDIQHLRYHINEWLEESEPEQTEGITPAFIIDTTRDLGELAAAEGAYMDEIRQDAITILPESLQNPDMDLIDEVHSAESATLQGIIRYMTADNKERRARLTEMINLSTAIFPASPKNTREAIFTQLASTDGGKDLLQRIYETALTHQDYIEIIAYHEGLPPHRLNEAVARAQTRPGAPFAESRAVSKHCPPPREYLPAIGEACLTTLLGKGAAFDPQVAADEFSRTAYFALQEARYIIRRSAYHGLTHRLDAMLDRIRPRQA